MSMSVNKRNLNIQSNRNALKLRMIDVLDMASVSEKNALVLINSNNTFVNKSILESVVKRNQKHVNEIMKFLIWLYRADLFIYLESSKVQSNSKVDEVVGNKDLRRYIMEYV